MMDDLHVAGPPPSGIAVTVSPMRQRHLSAVLAIEALVYPRAWSARLFREELERGGRVYLVARVGSTVVGYAGVLMIADDGHVATVAVHPEWQRNQIATRLLVELVREAMGLGANQLTLEVRMSNGGAQELYRRFGFAPAGARKAYYADDGEDALVMWAHEITNPDYEARLAALVSDLPSATRRQGFDRLPADPTSTQPLDHPATTPDEMTGS